MINAINGKNYSSYTVLNEQLLNVASEETSISSKSVQAEVDIQEILRQINEYTYTKQDEEAVDKDLVEDLRGKFNLKEEDIYELYTRGVDLEQLSIQEMTYQMRKQEQEKEKVDLEDESVEEKIQVIKQQHESMYLHSLNTNGPITINSLYENSFKGELKKGISQYTKEEVDHVLGMNGLQANQENEWAANLLMMYDIGVSPTSINRLQGIQSAVSALDVDGNYSGDDALVKDGQVQYQPEYVERITDELGMVTDEHIEKLIEEGKEINIHELRESIHKHASEALEEHQLGNAHQNLGEGQNSGYSDKGSMGEKVDAVKRQILQITTKLTVEAAQKISETMPLESSSLQAVADALTQMEHEMATSALEQVNLPVTKENISAITDTMNVVGQITQNFMPTVQIEIETGEQAVLSEIGVALTAYRENETPVETRFGESIKTVENQIANLLESQGIEATQTNIEAAKALITNQIEVNANQIRNIQDIVLKLDTFLEEMTPVQVATMIKEGFNPYNASVNEILSWMSDSKVEGLKTSVAEAIVSLEASGQINEEQKAGMIGLYRIMQAVADQKEQVMGYLYRNELPMTVENLQRAARYTKSKNRIEMAVDDSFGEVASRTEAKNTATTMLENSTEASRKTLETLKMLENMELPITEQNMDKVSKMSALLYPYIKEQFKKNVGKFEGMNTLPDSFLEKIQVAQNASSEVIENMLSQDIPLTLSNVYWMEKMSSHPEVYGELLNDKGLLKEGLPKDLEELENILEEIEIQVKEQKEEATLNSQWNDYRGYKQLEEIVKFQRQRIENEGLYQIPFMIDGEQRLVNLYVQDDKTASSIDDGTHLKAMISYETKTMGTVKAYIEMNGERIGYRVEAENRQDQEALKVHAKRLAEGLEAIGYHVNYSAFEQQEKETNQETVSNSVHKYDDSSFEEII